MRSCYLTKLHVVCCDNIQAGDGVGAGKEIHEGGDICILMADSSCCKGETNTAW